MAFINLHVHDEYSQLDGFGTAKAYAERAKFLDQSTLASTNHGNIDGLLQHQKACIAAGIKPILGCELYVVEDPLFKAKDDHRGHMIVLVRNEHGWKALCTLLSRANLEGFYRRPRVGMQWIRDLPAQEIDGLVIGTACLQSFLRLPSGIDLLTHLKQRTACFVEVMPWPSPEQVKWNLFCADLAEKFQLPLVATNDCHYILPEDAPAQEMLLAIQRKAKWSDPSRFRFSYQGLHLRSEREMIRAFAKHGSLDEKHYRSAIENSESVADICDYTIPKMEINLPRTKFESQFESPKAALLALVREAGQLPADYQARVDEELQVITEKAFERYFLLVWELVNWCKRNRILVGPGRGSVGGSLVAYLIGITEVDPLKYGLLFSRFISPDRNDYPDIDLDIEARRREEARLHLEKEYGLNCIAGISTFSRMKGRAVIRDVSRVFDLPAREVDDFAKSLPNSAEHSDDMVKTAIQNEPGKSFAARHPEAIDLAIRLEGQIRSSGQHPAALIVSADDLTQCGRGVVLEKEAVRVMNWSMEDSEHFGLMKLDALRLETLSVIGYALDLIKDPPGLATLPFDDPAVFQDLSAGNTAGVFQLSGYACRKLCVEMGVESFDDIVAITALARPGPFNSGMTEQFVSRRKGSPWPRSHCAEYRAIVEPTYGVLVYQEQVMQVFTDVAGLTPGMADKIRKVIGKKRDPKEFEPYKEKFIAGCAQRKTFTATEASEFWHGLLEWASYGFNKSHAVEYGMIAYWTAWLKNKYPAEYIAAFLTYGEEGQRAEVMRDAQRFAQLRVVTPKVGKSDPLKWTVSGKDLYMPFVAVKGIGPNDAEKCPHLRPPTVSQGLGGFFNLAPAIAEEQNKPSGTALQRLLTEICAWDPDPEARPKDHEKYFGCELPGACAPAEEIIAKRPQRSLTDTTPSPLNSPLPRPLRRPAAPSGDFVKETRWRNPKTAECTACALRQQATRVVLPSMGRYNVIIVGEAPGPDEDQSGMGFSGAAGKLLWSELGKHLYKGKPLTRRLFHVTNVCKCFPGEFKTPQKEHIERCKPWLLEEIKQLDCKLILALGNTPLFALTGRTGGITKITGTTEYIKEGSLAGVEVCWCVHPAAILRGAPKLPFEEGIDNFVSVFIDRLNDIQF